MAERDASIWLCSSCAPADMATTFVELYGDALAADGVALDSALDSRVGPDFASRAQEALRSLEESADGVRCLAFFSPHEGPDAGLLLTIGSANVR